MFRTSEPQTLKGKCVHAHKVHIMLLKLNKEHHKKNCGSKLLSSRNKEKASQFLTRVTMIAAGSDQNFAACFTNP